MRRLTFLVPLVGLWGVATVSPQQQFEPPVLSVRTDLVTLSVTVVDARGALVSGLRQEHFTVYDDGEPQAIQLFSSEDLPATIGLAIDSSGSMRGRREEVTAAVTAFATLSHPLDEFFTVNFNEAVWPGLPDKLPFTEDADELRAALATAPARGMTALYDAVRVALDHLRRGTHDRKALVVVSDGGDNASSETLDAVLEYARRTNVAIYTVTFADPDNRDAKPAVLKALARETGGHTFTPRHAAGVTRAFAQIAGEIRSGYTIGFAPAETSARGFRPIRVVAEAGNHRQLIARTRAGYYAGPSVR
jgi:Ca-activated chloride channel family protein